MSTVQSLLDQVEAIARKQYDGHLTIMRFTTHWKAMFGTPNLDGNGRREARALSGYPTLKEVLEALILDQGVLDGGGK